VPGANPGIGTIARGINDGGQIVGSYEGANTSQFHGFLLSGGAYTTLDDPLAGPTGDTEAFGINNAGQIVGLYQTIGNPTHGSLYRNGSYTTIDDPLATGPFGTVATGINDAGLIVGYYNTGGSFQNPTLVHHGFLYDGVTYTTIDDPLASNTNGGGTQVFG